VIGLVKEWLSARWPFSALYKIALEEEIPGGASFFYSFGSVILIVFSIQAATGIMQLFYYVPSVEDAYKSLGYLHAKVPFGWLIHGLHYWGAQVIIILMFLHVARVFLWGAYKRPRELTWIAGVVLLLVLMAFSLTGATLPWDQKGYWAGQVSTSVSGVIPVVGNVQKILLRGGEGMGQLTITRFFGIHVALLPLALMALFGFHIVAMRRFGNAGPWEEEKRTPPGPFWPDQVLKDAIVGTIVLFILITLVVFVPYEFSGPADRLDTTYVPKPEWNFLFLYESLKYFQGPLEPLGAAGVPGLLVTLLVLLPFIDRSPERNPFRRPLVVLSGFALAGVLVGFSVAGYLSPGYGAAAGAKEKKAEASGSMKWDMTAPAEAATTTSPPLPTPRGGGDARATGEAVTIAGDPEHGEELFERACARCHGQRGENGAPNPGSALGHVPFLHPIAPGLKSKDPRTFAENIDRFIRHGSIPAGPSPSMSMPSFKEIFSERQMADIIAYVMELNGVKVGAGTGRAGEGGPAPPLKEAKKAVGAEEGGPAPPVKEEKKAGEAEGAGVAGEKAPKPQAKESAPPGGMAAPGGGKAPLPAPATAGVNPAEVSDAAFIIGNVKRGAGVFADKCESCHGKGGKGGQANPGSVDGTIPELDPIDPAFKSKDPEEFAQNIDRFVQHGSVPEGSPAFSMPPFGDTNTLTQQQMANVISYVMHINGADRAEIVNPGIRPRRFYLIAVGALLLVGLALAGAWSKRSNTAARGSGEKGKG
jgi:ubiquinol-cytochrome c reductase cytochrome b subunit